MRYTQVVAYSYIESTKRVLEDSVKYKCRFCGKIKSETDFQKDAHAVSVCVGNETLLTKYECDDCNEKFGTEEEQIAKLFHLYKSVRAIKKRNGMPAKYGHKVDIRNSQNGYYVYTDEFHDKYQKITMTQMSENSAKIDFTSDIVVNLQSVYRCLIKYSLSVVPESMIAGMEKGYEMLNNNIQTKVNVCYVIIMYKEIEAPNIKIHKIEDGPMPRYFAEIDVFQNKYIVFLDFENDRDFILPDLKLEWLGLDKSDFYKVIKIDYSSKEERIHQVESVSGSI